MTYLLKGVYRLIATGFAIDYLTLSFRRAIAQQIGLHVAEKTFATSNGTSITINSNWWFWFGPVKIFRFQSTVGMLFGAIHEGAGIFLLCYSLPCPERR